MQGKSGPRGYPKQSIGLSSLRSKDFEEMVGAVDRRCAKAVDSIIDGLELNERCIIDHVYLHSVWTLPRVNTKELLESARSKIRSGLRTKGIE